MVSQTVTIKNAEGMHMRPANLFTKEMGKYKSDVTIVKDGLELNGKSLMNLLGAAIKKDCQIEIKCDGPDENEALKEAVGLVESGFGE